MFAAAVLALVVLAVAAPGAQAKEPPDVGCAEHIEGRGPLPAPDRSRDVVRGELTLMGARRLQRDRTSARSVRLGVMLDAGHEATIRVSPATRGIASLTYRFEHGGRMLEPVVNFAACASDAPRFSDGGTVGPRTIWAGGLFVHRPGCVRLLVWVDGARLDDVRVPLGRPCRS